MDIDNQEGSIMPTLATLTSDGASVKGGHNEKSKKWERHTISRGKHSSRLYVWSYAIVQKSTAREQQSRVEGNVE